VKNIQYVYYIINDEFMKTYRFRFNKKSITVTVNETLEGRGQDGGFWEAVQVMDAVRGSDIFTDDDKQKTGDLPLYQIYKMLKPI
jgi:hypothetical protein